MSILMNQTIKLLEDIIEDRKNEKFWYETNERYVIIEKFEKSSEGVYISQREISGSIYFYNDNNELHRSNNQPAVFSPVLLGWYKDGKLHRKNNKPATIRIETNEIENDNFPIEKYAENGLLHREFDLPAVIYKSEKPRLGWYLNGLPHRDKNKPAIINGDFLYYYKEGKLYDKRVDYKNKLVNWIIETPVYLITIIVLTFLWLQFF